jgi:hypothetical protein
MSSEFHLIIAEYLCVLSDRLKGDEWEGSQPAGFAAAELPPMLVDAARAETPAERDLSEPDPSKIEELQPEPEHPETDERQPEPELLEVPEGRRELPFQLEVSLAEARRLDGGSWLFPVESDDEPQYWCVFKRSGGADDAPVFLSTDIGSIRSFGTDEEFVKQAYRYILRREADDIGLRLYTGLLQTAEMSRRDLLVTLASSPEAQGFGYQMLIIPTPSRWLRDEALMVARPSEVDAVSLS